MWSPSRVLGGHLDLPCQSECKAPPFPVSTRHTFTKHFLSFGEDLHAKHEIFHHTFPLNVAPWLQHPAPFHILCSLFCRIALPFYWSFDNPDTQQLWESCLYSQAGVLVSAFLDSVSLQSKNSEILGKQHQLELVSWVRQPPFSSILIFKMEFHWIFNIDNFVQLTLNGENWKHLI